MATESKIIILVDGSSYLYRAFHALPALTNSKGFPTGAVYGFVNMLKRLINDHQPEYMAVIFDAKGKTFRDDIYTSYKATRKEMPSELSQQIKPIHDIINAFGLPLISIEGVEADDVIGTLATHAAKGGMRSLISTGDKDLAQLVNEHVELINTMTNTRLNLQTVPEKFGVAPERMIDYLTLVGDTSDNIPGVPMVGPKTAAKWLLEYGTLDNLVANAQNIKGKAGENLRASIAQFPLVKSLVTIKLDVEMPLSVHELHIKEQNKESLIALFREMEFKNWLSELLVDIKEEHATTTDYRVIENELQLKDFVNILEKANLFSFNVETTHNNYMTSDLVGLTFALEIGKGVYIPLAHMHAQQLNVATVLAALKAIFESSDINKMGLNLKFAKEVLAKYDIHLHGMAYDVMLESYLLDSASNAHDKSSLALKYLGLRTTAYEDIAGKGVKQLSFAEVDVPTATQYAAEEADIILRLHEKLWPRIAEEPGLKKVFTEIEMPLVNALANIERTGVLIDPEKLKIQGAELEKRLLELEKEAFQLSGKPFNMNSPKQLQEILFQQLKIPVLQKTPTDQPSTADNVLQELALEFAMPRIIIEYRSLSKLISTYTSPLIEQIDSQTGRVHTSYNQTGTSTGRLSSSDPNLQNIPIRTQEGRRIRKAFIASTGYKLVSADYSQIELRLMAHISEDPSLLNAFNLNLDIHKATAAEVWEVPLDQVTSDMRRSAKAINFGLIYGMSAFGLMRQLGIDRKSAQEYIERYFKRYPNVKTYMENTRLSAKRTGFVETLWGRRLYIPDINSSQLQRQNAAYRAAINAPLQGSAADIIKLAMIRIDQWLQEQKIAAKMIMQVHDELVFEVREDVLEEVTEGIRQRMSSVITLQVPLLVSVGIGDDWDIASEH